MPSCPGRLRSGSEGPRGHKAVPGDSGPAQRACRVDLLSRSTRACIQEPAGSTSCTGRLGPGSEYTRGRPAVPGDSCLCPRDCGVGQLSRATRSGSRARGFDQLSRANHARVRWPTGFIISPARLKHVLRARGVYQVPRATLARVLGPTGSTSCRGNLALGSEGPQGLPAVPGDPGPCPRARSRPSVPGGLGPGRTYRGFDQASRVTRARV